MLCNSIVKCLTKIAIIYIDDETEAVYFNVNVDWKHKGQARLHGFLAEVLAFIRYNKRY